MTGYLNGHTITGHMHHGERWYTVNEGDERFPSSAAAARWIRAHLPCRITRATRRPVPTTQALRRRRHAA